MLIPHPLRRVAYLGFRRLQGPSIGLLAELRRFERVSSSELATVRERRLAAILLWAAEHTVYYREVLGDAGVYCGPGSVRIDRLSSVPLLTKSHLRRHFRLLASDHLESRRWRAETTSGSTGEPVAVIQDEESLAWIRAGIMCFDSWTGWRPGDARLLLWGSERDLLVGCETTAVRAARALKNEVCLNAFRMSDDRMRRHVEIIGRHRPVLVVAYAEAAFELARFVEQNGLAVPAPAAVMTSAGTLRPEMRATIQRVFRAPVFDRYGSREAGGIACECRAHEGLHVAAVTHHVEILRPDGSPAPAGEPGEVVVTPTGNRAMPLIRYAIGDIASWSGAACPCGNPGPLLRQVFGRTTDLFVTARGGRTWVPHSVFSGDWIRRFQVVQETADDVRVVIETDERDPLEDRREELARIDGSLRASLGDHVRITTAFTSRLESAAAGKHRFFVSKVEAP